MVERADKSAQERHPSAVFALCIRYAHCRTRRSPLRAAPYRRRQVGGAFAQATLPAAIPAPMGINR